MDEAEAIARITRGAAPREGLILGPGDDAAVLHPPEGSDLVWTTDLQAEGRHFEMGWLRLDELAIRTLAVNLSDLAAMGARPWAYLLSLGIPPQAPPADLDELAAGLGYAEEIWGLALAGGHTWRHRSGWLLSLSMLGLAPAGRRLTQTGAKAGMHLWVTGTLGAAARGLEILASGRGGPRGPSERAAARRWIRPEPRLEAGRALLEEGIASAVVDLSDGLAPDLRRMCRASEVGAVVEESALPADAVLDDVPEGRRTELCLGRGEDYELLFAADPGVPVPKEIAGIPLTRIGELRPPEDGFHLRASDGDLVPLPEGGYDHLKEG